MVKKTKMLLGFVDDLHRAAATYAKERKTQNVPMGKDSNKSNQDESRLFTCSKEMLSQVIIQLSLNIAKMAETRVAEQEHFNNNLVNRLMEANANLEKTVAWLERDKREILEKFASEVRLATFFAISNIYADLGNLSVELADLRKTRRIEERKLRNRIIDEYDEMVSELVMENHVLRNRFNEYRTNTVREVFGIIAETKKEELEKVEATEEIPEPLRIAVRKTINYEDMMNNLKEDNHELQMTLLKVRSMFSIKEQALRSSFEKKIRKLSGDNKIAEQKLWDSYKDAESRERAIRRMLAKTTKSLISSEAHVDVLQKQLKEEQAKSKSSPAVNNRADRGIGLPSKPKVEADSSAQSIEAKVAELSAKLKRYEGINLDSLVEELMDKTQLVEDLVQRVRQLEKVANNAMISANATIPLGTKPERASGTTNTGGAGGGVTSGDGTLHFAESALKRLENAAEVRQAKIQDEMNLKLSRRIGELLNEKKVMKDKLIEAYKNIAELSEKNASASIDSLNEVGEDADDNMNQAARRETNALTNEDSVYDKEITSRNSDELQGEIFANLGNDDDDDIVMTDDPAILAKYGLYAIPGTRASTGNAIRSRVQSRRESRRSSSAVSRKVSIKGEYIKSPNDLSSKRPSAVYTRPATATAPPTATAARWTTTSWTHATELNDMDEMVVAPTATTTPTATLKNTSRPSLRLEQRLGMTLKSKVVESNSRQRSAGPTPNNNHGPIVGVTTPTAWSVAGSTSATRARSAAAMGSSRRPPTASPATRHLAWTATESTSTSTTHPVIRTMAQERDMKKLGDMALLGGARLGTSSTSISSTPASSSTNILTVRKGELGSSKNIRFSR